MAYDFLFANNATTTIAQAISSTATVITVASGDGALFPDPQSGQAFAVTLVDAETGLTNEICYCTSRSGDELTVIRGQEGKNAVAWSAGDTCANYITAGVIASWLQQSDLSGYLTETQGDGRYVKQYSDSNTNNVSQVGINKATGDFMAYSSGSWMNFQPAGDYATKTSISQFYPCTGSTTLPVPSWATRFEYFLTGGGGGGGGCQATGSSLPDTNASAGGGGSGATSIGVIEGLASGGVISVTIGEGGDAGNSGGTSSVAYSGTTYATAGGGGGASFTSTSLSAGGSPGSATSSNGVSVAGASGSDGQNGTMTSFGNGGASYWGGGGRGGARGGLPAAAFGAGGGGAYDQGFTGTFYAGGSGAAGFLLYRWLP